MAKQRRLFTQMSRWPFPISEILAEDQLVNDEAQSDATNPEDWFIDDLTLKQRYCHSIIHPFHSPSSYLLSTATFII